MKMSSEPYAKVNLSQSIYLSEYQLYKKTIEKWFGYLMA